MEEKIIEILKRYKDVCVEFMGDETAIDESNFKNIANEIIEFIDNEQINFFKWCEKYHFINPTGNYEEVIKQYKKQTSINNAI